MVLMSEKKSKEMAGNGLTRSFMDDSLENGDWKVGARASPSPKSSPTAVAPESKNGDVDYSAFSEEDALYLGLFPKNVLDQLQDKANWRNRVSGVNAMQDAISAASVDVTALESNLALVIDLLIAPVSDSHVKVAQAGLETVRTLAGKAGQSLHPYLPKLIQAILVKMGSNKYVVKQAGMSALRQLMTSLGPETVISEALSFGLKHKLSRVREESVNVITMALLSFPRTPFQFDVLLSNLCPALSDTKPRVRQAAFESVALLCQHLDLKHAVITIADSAKPSNGVDFSGVVQAVQARLTRRAIPRLNTDGLVEHAMPVLSVKPPSYSGPDIHWVLTGSKEEAASNGGVPLTLPLAGSDRRLSLAQSTDGAFHPYRGVGKRLPWEKGSQQESAIPSTTPATSMVNSHWSGVQTNPVFGQTPPRPPLMPARTHPSPKNALGIVPSPYSLPPGIPPKRSGYSDIHLMKVQRSGSTQAVPPPTPRTLPPPKVPGKAPGRDSNHVIWTKAYGTPAAMPKASQQISADVNNAVGSVHGPVRTSVTRPLSKPRVRNPLTSLKPKKPSGSSPQGSPTQTEKEFLMSSADPWCSEGKGAGSDEEYFSSIPEDVAILDSSLSSSLSSLCASGKSGEIDRLKYIRKQAASRKAQLLSASASASNSPEHSATPLLRRNTVVPVQTSEKQSALSALASLSKLDSEEIARLDRETRAKLKALKREMNSTYIVDSGGGDRPASHRRSPKSKTAGSSPRDSASDLSQTDKGTASRNIAYTIDSGGGRAATPRRLSRSSDSSPRDSASDISQTTVPRRKQKKLDFQLEEQPERSRSSSKPPLPPNPIETSVNSAPLPSQKPRRPRRRSLVHVDEPAHVMPGGDSPKRKRGSSQLTSSLTQPNTTSTNGSPVLDELHPFSSPERALRVALRDVDSHDWSYKCDGMLAMRRLAMFHPDVLTPQLHTATLAVQREVKNLRSQVSRAAIACFGDLFALMGRAMDSDADTVASTLLHKGGESNMFIREDVEKALIEMTNNLNQSRSLHAIIAGGVSHRSPQVRKLTSQLIVVCVERFGPQKLLQSTRDLEKALPAILQLVGDNDPEARYHARKALNCLRTQPEFDQISTQMLSPSLLSKLKSAVEFLRTKGVGDSPTEAQSAKQHHAGAGSNSRHSTGGSVRRSAHSTPARTTRERGCDPGQDSSPPTDTAASAKDRTSKRASKKHVSSAQDSALQNGGTKQLPDGLLERLKSSDWNERHDAIAELEDFSTAFPVGFGPHLHKVFDVFGPRLTDRNSKINLRALQAFSTMVPLLGNALIPVLGGVVSAVVPNLASKNLTIKTTAEDIIDLLVQCVDPVHLLQPYATNAQYGNARVQPIIIKKLADAVKLAHPLKPGAVSRQVLPFLWHLLSARAPPTGDVKEAVAILCGALRECMGQSLEDSASHLPPAAQGRLGAILSELNR